MTKPNRIVHPSAYYHTYLQSPEGRVQALVNLQDGFRDQIASMLRDADFFRALESLESQVRPGTPTMGIEIEVSWSSLFPDHYEKYFLSGQKRYPDFTPEEKGVFHNVCASLDEGVLHQFERTRDIAIPAGKDAYWEFAHLPSRHWAVLAEEVHILKRLGLVPGHTRHALHITLGDMTANRDTYFLLSLLELMNGDNGERMTGMSGKNSFSTTWSRRGHAGLRERSSKFETLFYGVTEAIELRTLELPEEDEEIDFLLKTVQILAYVICLKRSKKDLNPIECAAVKNWDAMIDHVCHIFEGAGMNPHKRWSNPQNDQHVWQRFSEFLQTPEKALLEANLRARISEIHELFE